MIVALTRPERGPSSDCGALNDGDFKGIRTYRDPTSGWGPLGDRDFCWASGATGALDVYFYLYLYVYTGCPTIMYHILILDKIFFFDQSCGFWLHVTQNALLFWLTHFRSLFAMDRLRKV